MKARLLCYRPAIDKHLLDNAITYYTYAVNPKIWKYPALMCGHSAIWMPDEDGNFITDFGFSGTVFTSTMRYAKGQNGVVKQRAVDVLKNPERWFWFEFELVDANFACGWLFNKVLQNQGYDKKALITFFVPWEVHDKDKYICSEHAFVFIFKFAVLDSPYLKDEILVPSPIRLAYYMYTEGGIHPIDLKTNEPLKLRK